MANVLFVSYAGYPYTLSSLCPDNGLAILASILKQAGHDVEIMDYGTVDTIERLYPQDVSEDAASALGELGETSGAPSEALRDRIVELDRELSAHHTLQVQGIAQEVANRVADVEPAFVGFKLWNGDGFTGSVAIAEHIRRELPSVRMFAGGPQATWGGSAVFKHTNAFDGVILGEAEDKILQILDAALGRQDAGGIPAVVTAAGEKKSPTVDLDLNDVPPGSYDEDVYPAMRGDQKLKMFVLDDSRGCPYCCAFCMHPYESGRKLRTRSARRIVDDMEAIVEGLGMRTFRFAGSSTPGALMSDVAHEIKRRKLRVVYTSFAHFDNSVADYYKLMHECGMHSMFFGLESASEEILRRGAEKRLDLDTARELLTEAKRAGIKAVCSMIVPMPFETQETLQQSVEFLTQVRPDSVPVQFPGLIPGTRWYEEPMRYNFEVDKSTYLESNLDYKFKMLFPPVFWQPLGYKVNGMGFHEFTAVTADFAGRLERAGLLTGVPDENMMMAHLTGLTPRQFRDQSRFWAVTGNAGAIGQFVAEYNRAASSEDIRP